MDEIQKADNSVVYPSKGKTRMVLKKRQKRYESAMMLPYCENCGKIVFDCTAAYCCWCGYMLEDS